MEAESKPILDAILEGDMIDATALEISKPLCGLIWVSKLAVWTLWAANGDMHDLGTNLVAKLDHLQV
jgi:methanogenic corrinoid protein MtbC1